MEGEGGRQAGRQTDGQPGRHCAASLGLDGDGQPSKPVGAPAGAGKNRFLSWATALIGRIVTKKRTNILLALFEPRPLFYAGTNE